MQPYAPYPLNLIRDGYHRRRWLIRIVLAIILVPCIFFWTWNRLTATPAEPGGGGSLILPPTVMPNFDAVIRLPPPDVDRTIELAAAIMALPAMPATQPLPTPPNGMMWQEWNPRQFTSTDPMDASAPLSGPWEPDRRLQQRLFLEYLRNPQVRKTLEEITELSTQPAALTHSSGLGYMGGAALRQVARVLVARARSHAEFGDHTAALADLQAVIHLTANYEDDGLLLPVLGGQAFRGLAMSEMVLEARTLPQPAAHRREALNWLKAHPVDVRALYLQAMRGECALHHAALDLIFPENEHGRERAAVDPGAFAPGLDQFLRIQNLVAWVYDNRNAHTNYIDAICELEQDALGSSFSQCNAWFSRMASYTPPPTRTYVVYTIDMMPAVIARGQADYEIALATLAALTWHADHGHYPDQLADLVPDYLDEIPNDPFVDEPLRYRLDDKFGFIAYSVGENMTDNGGRFQLPSGEDIPHEELDDYFSVRPRDGRWRSEPDFEWFLVPAEPAVQDNSTAPEAGDSSGAAFTE